MSTHEIHVCGVLLREHDISTAILAQVGQAINHAIENHTVDQYHCQCHQKGHDSNFAGYATETLTIMICGQVTEKNTSSTAPKVVKKGMSTIGFALNARQDSKGMRCKILRQDLFGSQTQVGKCFLLPLEVRLLRRNSKNTDSVARCFETPNKKCKQ